MTITSSGPQTIQKPVGDTVQLGCTYTPAAQDVGELDIEWSNVSPDMTQKDKLVSYFVHFVNNNKIFPFVFVNNYFDLHNRFCHTQRARFTTMTSTRTESNSLQLQRRGTLPSPSPVSRTQTQEPTSAKLKRHLAWT